jgi:hypothetical protein
MLTRSSRKVVRLHPVGRLGEEPTPVLDIVQPELLGVLDDEPLLQVTLVHPDEDVPEVDKVRQVVEDQPGARPELAELPEHTAANHEEEVVEHGDRDDGEPAIVVLLLRVKHKVGPEAAAQVGRSVLISPCVPRLPPQALPQGPGRRHLGPCRLLPRRYAVPAPPGPPARRQPGQQAGGREAGAGGLRLRLRHWTHRRPGPRCPAFTWTDPGAGPEGLSE